MSSDSVSVCLGFGQLHRMGQRAQFLWGSSDTKASTQRVVAQRTGDASLNTELKALEQSALALTAQALRETETQLKERVARAQRMRRSQLGRQPMHQFAFAFLWSMAGASLALVGGFDPQSAAGLLGLAWAAVMVGFLFLSVREVYAGRVIAVARQELELLEPLAYCDEDCAKALKLTANHESCQLYFEKVVGSGRSLNVLDLRVMQALCVAESVPKGC